MEDVDEILTHASDSDRDSDDDEGICQGVNDDAYGLSLEPNRLPNPTSSNFDEGDNGNGNI